MKDDNLFAESSMSFGDHLEELRKCLFASIYWIAIGTTCGFLFGQFVVETITVPVETALEKYFEEQRNHYYDALRPELESEGISDSMIDSAKRDEMIPFETFIYPGELERVLNRQKLLRHQQKNELAPSETLAPLAQPLAATPSDVDNLITQKKSWAKKQAEIFDGALDLSGAEVDYNVEPIRLMLFTKKENDPRTKVKALGVYEVFWIWIQASLVVGLVFSSPFVSYHLWSFVAAGLYPHEKKYVYYFIPVSIVLVLGGAAFAFFVVFQFVLDFLFGFNAMMNIDPDPRVSEWLKFALMLPVGFGFSFQLPVILFVLERVGIFSYQQYMASWRISVLAIFLISLLLTPGDPGSMLLMAIPLTILYFGGVFCCWLFPRKKGLFDIDEEDRVDDF
jgi:sec-independent protein translocase protein TatC